MERGGQKASNQEARVIKELSKWIWKVTKSHDRKNTGD